MVCKNRFFVVSLQPKSVIMRESFTEITRLEPLDIFYVGDRHKTYFEYPAHCHEVYELNFVENAAGVERTIGDSRETIGNLDLVLITGSKLVHVWEQGTCPEQDIHEITIHIDPDTFHGTLMDKRAFASIRRMLECAQRGLAFPEPAIQILREDIINLAQSNDSFASVIRLFNLLYRLSLVENARELSSSSFVNAREENEDERVRQVKEYIAQNYTRDIALQELADIACMAPESSVGHRRAHVTDHPTGGLRNRFLLRLQHPQPFQPSLPRIQRLHTLRIPRTVLTKCATLQLLRAEEICRITC